jgi:glutaredoxin
VANTIDFYWRPGCPFCMGLERNLNKLNLPLNKMNIWDDDAHAATVRSIADGNETVPTVVIGDAKMVNPSADQVLQAISNQAPELMPEGVEAPTVGKAGRMINKLLGG